MSNKNSYTFFVYGSLLTGFYNYDKFLKGKVIATELGSIIGTLYHLQNKGYPGCIAVGEQRVFGEIITFDNTDGALDRIDDLEGYKPNQADDNEYNRTNLVVNRLFDHTTVNLDVYLYNPHSKNNQNDTKILLPNGDWRHYMLTKNK